MYIEINDTRKKDKRDLVAIVIDMGEDEAVIIRSKEEAFTGVVVRTDLDEFVYYDNANGEFVVLDDEEQVKGFFHPSTYELPQSAVITVVEQHQITLTITL